MTNDLIPKKYDLEERTARFGENVIKFCKKVPRGPITDPLITQLTKCGTSVGANYCEADDAEATKILSLSFRLFGNIFAGEVLLTTASTKLFAFIIPIPFYFLEILVGFVQALIFAMLTLVFMTILTQKAEH